MALFDAQKKEICSSARYHWLIETKKITPEWELGINTIYI